MKPTRRIIRSSALLALAAVWLLAAAVPALAVTAPPKTTLKLNAPIAVRVGKSFTIRGSASSDISPGETITVTMERHGSSWSVVSTAAVTVGSHQQYSAILSAGKRGHWRVRVDASATTSHTAAGQSAAFKVVGSKVVALTFDDGPWPSSTAGIISALAKNDAQATFFTLGSQIASRKALVKLELANGNAVGVHSWNHALMTKRSASTNKADLARCKKVLAAATGKTPTWFRPPYGATNSTLKKTAASLGLRQVIWTVDTLDWKYRTTSSVVSRALAGTRDGSVVLMHDGGGPRKATVAAAPIIIKKLRAKGYDFVTLDEMVALGYKVR